VELPGPEHEVQEVYGLVRAVDGRYAPVDGKRYRLGRAVLITPSLAEIGSSTGNSYRGALVYRLTQPGWEPVGVLEVVFTQNGGPVYRANYEFGHGINGTPGRFKVLCGAPESIPFFYDFVGWITRRYENEMGQSFRILRDNPPFRELWFQTN
jgi:hypothetical protein